MIKVDALELFQGLRNYLSLRHDKLYKRKCKSATEASKEKLFGKQGQNKMLERRLNMCEFGAQSKSGFERNRSS